MTIAEFPVRLAALAGAASAAVLLTTLATGPLPGDDIGAVFGALPAVAALGVLVAAAVLVAGPRVGVRRGLLVLTPLLVLAFGVLFQTTTTISLFGYLVAMALPVGLAVLVVQIVRRYPRLRAPVLLGTAGLVALGISTGPLSGPSLIRLGAVIGSGFVTSAPRLITALTVTAAAVAWLAVLASLVRGATSWRRIEAAVVAHRTAITVIAACGPLPYALARLTWLTPWPQFSPAASELTSETRLWGLLLGGAALLGSVLTIGLIRPWGERFPRWMPGLAGRNVPIDVAAVPGFAVAAAVSASAVPMLVALTFTSTGHGVGIDRLGERILIAFILPLWIWGPMLALAVWGYVADRRRRSAELDRMGTCSVSSVGSPG